MKSPMEVINSDNSSQINAMKEQVVEVCDIMFKNFEDAVERSSGCFDRTVVVYDTLPRQFYYDDRDFMSMIKTHFLNMVDEWSKYVELKFGEDYAVPWIKTYEIICRFDTKKNCYIEVERN